MKTVNQAFEEFLSGLELTDHERDEASRQHTHLRTELQQRMAVEDNFLSGSYARRTAIRPLHDIDVFLVLRETAEHSRSSEPHHVLGKVREALAAAYPGKTPRVQARSVNIEFSGTGIAYDVVPAFRRAQDEYSIPDRDADKWIATNPRIHGALSTDANERTNKRIKPLLKAVKHANAVHEGGARSFHLEVLSWEVTETANGSYLDGLTALLERLHAGICLPCPDPAGLGPDIRPPLDRCRTAQSWLSKMHTLARDARSLSLDGRTGEAHAKLRALFGDAWSESGSSPRRGASVIVSGGVDGGGSSFG